MSYSVVIVGLGAIGMAYDLDQPDKAQTHARAFHLHPDFELMAVVDSHEEARRLFSQNYPTPTLDSVSKLSEFPAIDVVVLATPTTTHGKIVNEVVAVARPKVILCEKPLAYKADEASQILNICRQSGIGLLVNYIRRADPGVIEAKSRIDCGDMKLPFKAIAWYTKGLLHSGSHLFDLLTFWFGSCTHVELINHEDSNLENDGEPDFRIQFESGSAIFCSAKEENFSHYSAEVVLSNGRLRYESNGDIIWQYASAHQDHKARRSLNDKLELINNEMCRYQLNVANQLLNYLREGDHTLCTGDKALQHIQTLEPLIHSI